MDLRRLETLSPFNRNLQSLDHLPGLEQLCAAPHSPSDTPGRPLLGKPGPSEDSACRHPQVGGWGGNLCGVIAWPEGGQELREPRKDTGSSNASQASRQGWMDVSWEGMREEVVSGVNRVPRTGSDLAP